MKFLKAIFSRTVITLAVIFLQFIFIYALFHAIDTVIDTAIDGILGNFSWLVSFIKEFIMLLLTIILCCIIVNRPIIADAKVPWLIIVAFGPIFGLVLYTMFSSYKVSKKKAKEYFDIAYASRPYSYQFKDYSSRLGIYSGQANYLRSTSDSPIFAKTESTYYASGEEFWKALLSELRQAKRFIFMEYFIIQCGKMWGEVLSVLREKVAEGVEVRFMYDDIGCMGKIPNNYDKTLCDLGIDCVKFNKFVPIASEVHNNRDHRKITVIDGRVGFMGGANIADEYINENKRFGEWKDSAVRLRGSAVRTLTVLFLRQFDVQKGIRDDFREYMPTDVPDYADDGIIVPFGDGPRPVYEEQIAENAFLNMINFASKYIWITTPYLILDTTLKTALIRAALRGVDVRIITPHVPDKKMVFYVTRRNYDALLKHWIKIYEYTPGFIHAKNIIADDVNAIVGTINFDYRSLVHHYECGVWMYKTSSLQYIKADIESTINRSMQITKENYKQPFFQKVFTSVLMMFAPLL